MQSCYNIILYSSLKPLKKYLRSIDNYIMANEYSNIILFYCFANKLIAVKEKINNMMSNDNIYQTLPLNNALRNYLQNI